MADKVRQAKKDGFADNFIYGSVSSSYLAAIIDAFFYASVTAEYLTASLDAI